MSEQKYIMWDIPMRERLRAVYKEALATKQESFMFEGAEFLTRYAKYLLEHLDGQLGVTDEHRP